MKKYTLRRLVMMVLAIFVIGLGLELFILSAMGSEASSSFARASGNTFGIPFSINMIVLNCVYFVAEILFGRDMIGPGTFVNWCFVGISTTVWEGILQAIGFVPSTMPERIVFLLSGVIVLSFAVSLYQTADTGIAPYDTLAILLSRKLPIPYFWCRMMVDCTCVVLTLVFHGAVGVGTVICSLCLGPFVAFFNTYASQQLCGIKKK